jgi:excisionase family DNA binding protein
MTCPKVRGRGWSPGLGFTNRQRKRVNVQAEVRLVFLTHPQTPSNTGAQLEGSIFPGEERKMHPEVTREWVTYKQAEKLTGLSRTTLWRLINTTGEVETTHVGRAVRINRASLTSYMKRSTTTPPSGPCSL